ncbi:MAG: patatin-like phospholipase family protein [Anaerolineae bacterium]|nr:patatin-like phospholipase family protein [Anaerolineae bacterium]
MKPDFPFRNLVFQGGGVKTFAYYGVLDVLEQHGILPQIERVAGTSAGAMFATLVSFRLSAAETLKVFSTVDFGKVPGLRTAEELLPAPPTIFKEELDSLLGGMDALSRLFSSYGWYSTDYVYEWLQETIAAHCQGNGKATFADFRALGHRDLYVVATNISTRSGQIFSADSTPNVPVADALRMSQSIPLFFEGLRHDGSQFGTGDYYADGGVLNNFPIFIFDDPVFLSGNRWYISGINWETLGCRLYTPKDCPGNVRAVTSLTTYIENLMDAVLEAQEVAFGNNKVDQQRTINVSNCCVQPTDFEVKPAPDNPKYHQLVAAGREAAQAYLRAYQPPSTHIRDWVRRYVLGR